MSQNEASLGQQGAYLHNDFLVDHIRVGQSDLSLPSEIDKEKPLLIQGEPVYFVVANVTPPRAISSPDPEYSDEARNAQLQHMLALVGRRNRRQDPLRAKGALPGPGTG